MGVNSLIRTFVNHWLETKERFVGMKEWIPEKIVELLMDAGHIAMKYYEMPRYEFKEDKSIVTVADREIERFLSGYFDKPDEKIYLIGEETVLTKNEKYIQDALRETAWVVDPIDGTVPYAHHIPAWGISIGFMREGKIREGAIFLPGTGDMFVTSGEKVLYKCSPDGINSWDFSDLSEFIPTKNRLGDGGIVSLSQMVIRTLLLDIPNPLFSLVSAVFPMTYLCLGRFQTYIASVKLWDYAGALAILSKCGFTAKFLDGKKMTLNVKKDCLVNNSVDLQRWKARDYIVFSPDDKTADHYIKMIKESQCTGEN